MPDASPSLDPASESGFDPHVVFDFDGALHLARQLLALADDWARSFAEFEDAADAALTSWSGPHRERAAEAIGAERRDSEAVVESLRSEANRWARAWAVAAEDLRRERWLAAVVAAQDGPPLAPPAPVGVPSPPGFEPTADLVVGGRS